MKTYALHFQCCFYKNYSIWLPAGLRKSLCLLVFTILTCFFSTNKADASQPNLDSLREIVALNLKDTNHLSSLNLVAFYAQYSNLDESLKLYRDLYDLALHKDNKKYLSIASIQMALIFQELNQPDSSLIYMEISSSVKHYIQDDVNTLYNYYNALGLIYKGQDKPELALEAHLKIEHELGDKLNIDRRAGNYFNIAALYSRLFDAEKQIDYLFQAIELFESTGNLRGIAFGYNALGNIYYTNKDYVLAEVNYRKSLSFRSEATDKRGIAAVLGNIGNVLADNGQPAEAIQYFNRAIAIYDSVGAKNGMLAQMINLGRAFSALPDYNRAILQFNQAIELARELNDQKLKAFALAEKGNNLLAMGDHESALNAFLQINLITPEVNDLQVIAKVQRGLRDIYYQRGMYKEAYDANALYQIVKDSVDNTDLKLKLGQLETRLEIQRKQTEIDLLRIDRELSESQIARQRGRLTIIVISFLSIVLIGGLLFNRFRLLQRSRQLLEMERMRIGIAQDLHDDIGSALSSINILSQMAASKPSQEAGSALTRIHKYTSGVMERMGDIVWSIQPGNDSFEKLLIKMREFAGEILEPLDIDYEFHGDESLNGQKANLELKKNVFLIYKEALNNIAKYSKADKVNIGIELNNHRLKMKVSDNGSGFDPNTTNTGNGLKNMAARAKSIGGALKIDSEKGRGSSILLEVNIT